MTILVYVQQEQYPIFLHSYSVEHDCWLISTVKNWVTLVLIKGWKAESQFLAGALIFLFTNMPTPGEMGFFEGG
jgi:hypothetical protein